MLRLKQQSSIYGQRKPLFLILNFDIKPNCLCLRTHEKKCVRVVYLEVSEVCVCACITQPAVLLHMSNMCRCPGRHHMLCRLRSPPSGRTLNNPSSLFVSPSISSRMHHQTAGDEIKRIRSPRASFHATTNNSSYRFSSARWATVTLDAHWLHLKSCRGQSFTIYMYRNTVNIHVGI